MITLSLETTKYKRGRGFWKVNCSLLQDKNYVEMIKNTISETVQENCQAHPALLWDTVNARLEAHLSRIVQKNKEMSIKF